MAENRLSSKVSIVVIGGSAGSLDIILNMLDRLEATISFPIVIVVHRKASFDSSLTDLLALRTLLAVKEAEEKEKLSAGVVYVAPADYHLLIEKDRTFSLDYSERLHYSRPAIDATFETAAEVYGPGTVGILLSGANADGANGLKVIHEVGGLTAIQDPEMAEVAYMPRQALAKTTIDYILHNEEVGLFINMLSQESRFYSA